MQALSKQLLFATYWGLGPPDPAGRGTLGMCTETSVAMEDHSGHIPSFLNLLFHRQGIILPDGDEPTRDATRRSSFPSLSCGPPSAPSAACAGGFFQYTGDAGLEGIVMKRNV